MQKEGATIDILIVKDKDMKEIGRLENAYGVPVRRTVNELWVAGFSLPKSDVKNALCDHMNYIDITSESGRYYGLYRIMPKETKMSATEESIEYSCEHVFSTLLDDVMPGYHQLSGMTTASAINYILGLQETQRWVLGTCDFTRYFEYAFENENGLLAPLLSLPKSFDLPYEFTFDTTVYPWQLNLIQPSNVVKSECRWGKDIKSFSDVSDPSSIVNYIVPLGAGEGVNQLTIESVNGGLNYLKDDASITKWGKCSYIWIDKRFTSAQSLKENAQSLLELWKAPTISFSCESVDLSILPEYALERKLLNSVTRTVIDGEEYEARIISESIADLSKEYEVKYTINNKLDDISTTQTDLKRKQQVNDAYSQGATNILAFSYHDNADNDTPAIISFFLDDDVVNVNTCELTYETKKFRAYSQATQGGGATTTTSSSGGGSSATSSSGGGTSTSTSSGGGGSTTADTNVFAGYMDSTSLVAAPTGVEHRHAFNLIPEVFTHNHDVTIPGHAHDFSVPEHSHDVDIPNHNHDITLESHTHSVQHGIYELEAMPTALQIKVDGTVIQLTALTSERFNIVDYLSKTDGRIVRGKHTIEILPNALARIEADIILRVFIQSHLGNSY